MSITNKILFILTAFWVITLTGCIDEPVAPTERIIHGKIYPVDILSLDEDLISIGYYPIASSTSDGSFEIASSMNPYDLTVSSHNPYFNYTRYISTFAGLTIDKPQIVFHRYGLGIGDPPYPVACKLNIFFPEIKVNNKVIVCKFVSSSDFNQPPFYVSEPLADSINTIVYLPEGQNTISGKIYFFEWTYAENEITSYDNYGVKDIVLHPGGNTPLTFESSDLLNPGEVTVPASVHFKEGFFLQNSITVLNITAGEKQHQIAISDLYEPTGTVLVPLINTPELKIRMYSHYSNLTREGGYQWIAVNPGAPLVMKHNETIHQLLPVNRQSNITDTTTFLISDDDEPAIYEHILEGRNILKFYTNKKSLKFSDFRSRDFIITPFTQYYWSVKKYASYSSNDEFVTKPYLWNDRDTYIETSRSQYFFTAP